MRVVPLLCRIIAAVSLLATTSAAAGFQFETPVPSAGSGVTASAQPVDVQPNPVPFSRGFPSSFALTPPVDESVDCFDIDTDSTLNDGNRFIPADASCAVGPNRVMTIGSGVVEWRTISPLAGAPEYQASIKTFFSSLPAPGPGAGSGTTLGTYCFNPKVIYDQYAGRFIVVVLERWDTTQGKLSNESRILLAISKTGNPNDGFWRSAIDSKRQISGMDTWADFPGVAVDDKALYITNNMFQFGASPVFRGVRLWIINKPLSINGPDNGVLFTVHNPFATAGIVTTTTPAHMFGALPTGSGGHSMGTFLLSYSGITDGIDEYLQIVELTDPLNTSGGPFFTVQAPLDIGDIEDPVLAMPNASQSGSAYTIETNDRRLLSAVWRNQNLYCTATIRGPVASADANQATARWWRLDTTSTSAVAQADSGNIGGEDIAAGTHTFFPMVMVDMLDNMVVGFSASGPARHCGAYYTTRLATDAPGTTTTPGVLAVGTDYYKRYLNGSSNRWGNYGGIALAPDAQLDFWIFNQYAGPRGSAGTGSQGAEDGRWQTRLGVVEVAPPTAASMLPSRTMLYQNIPNPFNPVTTIRFSIEGPGRARVAIYDVNGRLVRMLFDEVADSGSHTVTWNGRDRGNVRVASGVYFYRLSVNGQRMTKKMVLLK